MPESKIYTFEFRELAEIMVKKADVHDGLWGIYLEFGLAAANVPVPPDPKSYIPAAINLVQKIGIQRSDIATNLTVDAAQVNPAIGKTLTKKKSTKK